MSEVGNLSVKLSLDNAQFDRSVASMNRTLQAMGQEIRGLQNKGKDWGASIDGLRQKQDAYSRLLEGQQTKVKKLSQAYEEAKNKFGENSTQAEKLAVQLNRANAEMTRTERELSEVTAELRRQEAELARSQTVWARFGEAAEQAGAKLKAVGDKMTSIGRDLSMKVTAPLTALGAGIIKVGMDFDSQMSKVAAVSGATGDNFDALRAKAQELGATTKFTATQAAEGFEYLALAGYKTEQQLAAIDGLLALAAASGMDLGRAADITTDVMSAFGLEASKAGHAADVFAYAQANANTNVEQIGEAMKYAAPMANQMGWSLEQTTAAMMKLADNGLKGSIAGQAFASSLGRLAKPTKQMRNTMEDLNIEFFDAEGNMKSLPDIIAHLGDRFDGLNMKQKSAAITTLFGAEAYKHWAILLESGSDILNKHTESLENADGTAQKMAETMVDNLGGSLLMLKSAVEGLMIQFSDLIKGDVRAFADFLTELAGKFAALDDSTKKIILVVGALAAALGPVVVVLGILTSSFGSIVTAMGAMSTAVANAGGIMGVLKLAFAALTGPIGLTIAAVVAVGAAMVLAYQHFEGFRNVVDTALNAAMSIVKSVMGAIKDFVLNIWGQITQFWKENGEQIKQATSNVWTAIKAVIDAVMPVISAVIKAAMLVIEVVIKQVWEAVKGTIQGALDVILGLVKMFASLFTGDWKGLWEGVKQLVSGAVELIWNLMQLMFFGKLLSGLKTFAASFSGLFTSLWTTIKGLFTSSTAAISKAVTTAFNAIKNVANTSMTGVKNIVTTVWNAVKSVFTVTVNGIVNAVKTGFTTILNTIKSIMTGVVNAVKSAGTLMFNAGKDLIQGLVNGIKNMKDATISAITGVVDGVVNKAKSLLGIKSPSRVMMAIGEFTGEGLAIGLDQSSEKVRKATESIGNLMINETKEYTASVKELNKKEADELAKIENDKNYKIEQIISKAKASKKKLTAAQNAQIDKIESDAAAKTVTTQQKYADQLVKINDDLNKSKLDAVKKFIEDKKSLDELSLIDEALLWQHSLEQFGEKSKERIEAQKSYQSAVQAINKEITAINTDYSNQVNKINEDLIKQEETLTKAYEDAVDKRAQSLVSFKNLFDAFKVEIDVTGEELLANLGSQVQGFKAWQQEVEKLSEKAIDKGLLEELRQMGPNALPELIALNQLTDRQLQQYSALYKEKSALARKQAEAELVGMKNDTDKQIRSLRDTADRQLVHLQRDWNARIVELTQATATELSSLQQIGKDAGQGLLNGLSSMQGPLISRAQDIANQISQAIRSALQVKSPSRVMMEIGGYVGEGLIVGMDDMISKVAQSSARLAGAVTNAQSSLASSANKSRSNQIVQQQIIQQGTNVDMNSLIAAITELASRPVETAVNLDGRVVAETITPFVSNIMGSDYNSQLRRSGWKR